jgi:flavin reductase (DIM6/NTAB) family NADH-FMN oxidoreductase RutF
MSESSSDRLDPRRGDTAKSPRRLTTIEDTRAYRNCVGEFATGVTVVTSEFDQQPAGMTLNSFTSISLHPLLLLISMAHGARTLHAIRQSGEFTVSILQRTQGNVAVAFAERSASFPDQLAPVDRRGMRSVSGAAATLWCEVEQIITAGDHDLVIGEVIDFQHRGGEPLLFYRGTLGGLQPDTHMPANHPIGLEEGAGW